MRLLLIDTCGEVGSVALAEGEAIVATHEMPARAASAELLTTLQSLLHAAAWSIKDITGIGVVNGPGSFTGVRVGLACAKGLCEALAISLAAVSRLKVLASAANLTSGYAVLNAGRGEVFVLDAARQSESLMPLDEAVRIAQGSPVAVAEAQLVPSFAGSLANFHSLHASSSLALVAERFHKGADDVAVTDANYLRGEQQIYGKTLHPKAKPQ